MLGTKIIPAIIFILLAVMAKNDMVAIIFSSLFYFLVAILFKAPLIFLNIIIVIFFIRLNHVVQKQVNTGPNKLLGTIAKPILVIGLCILTLLITPGVMFASGANLADARTGNDATAMLTMFIILPLTCYINFVLYKSLLKKLTYTQSQNSAK